MSNATIRINRIEQDRIGDFLVRVAAMTLIMVLSSRAVIPIPGTPVPLTLQVFGLFAGALFMGPAESGLGMLLYVFLGATGLGVFAHNATLAQLGVGAGYVAGMVLAAPVIGILRQRVGDVWASITGLFMIYVSGTAYLCTVAHVSLFHAIVIGVLPFVAPDLMKVGVAAWMLRGIRP